MLPGLVGQPLSLRFCYNQILESTVPPRYFRNPNNPFRTFSPHDLQITWQHANRLPKISWVKLISYVFLNQTMRPSGVWWLDPSYYDGWIPVVWWVGSQLFDGWIPVVWWEFVDASTWFMMDTPNRCFFQFDRLRNTGSSTEKLPWRWLRDIVPPRIPWVSQEVTWWLWTSFFLFLGWMFHECSMKKVDTYRAKEDNFYELITYNQKHHGTCWVFLSEQWKHPGPWLFRVYRGLLPSYVGITYNKPLWGSRH